MRERQRLQKDCSEGGRTHQEFKDECDINILMARYLRTGQMPEATTAQYLDITKATDYQTAQNIKIQADEAFLALPAKVRKDFDNDPHAFLLALNDPENAEYFEEVGIYKKRKIEDPQPDPEPAPTPPPSE